MWLMITAALAAAPVTFTVTANSGRSCVAALHVQSAEPVPVVLSMAGSGLYTSTTDPVPLWYQARVTTRQRPRRRGPQ